MGMRIMESQTGALVEESPCTMSRFPCCRRRILRRFIAYSMCNALPITPCRFMWDQPPSAVRSSAAQRALDGKAGSALLLTFAIKDKRRPRAAGVETTAEDIRLLRRI